MDIKKFYESEDITYRVEVHGRHSMLSLGDSAESPNCYSLAMQILTKEKPRVLSGDLSYKLSLIQAPRRASTSNPED